MFGLKRAAGWWNAAAGSKALARERPALNDLLGLAQLLRYGGKGGRCVEQAAKKSGTTQAFRFRLFVG